MAEVDKWHEPYLRQSLSTEQLRELLPEVDKWLREERPGFDFGSDPQGGMLAYVGAKARFLPGEERLAGAPDPKTAVLHLRSKGNVADRYVKLCGTLERYLEQCGPMDTSRFGDAENEALVSFGRMWAHASTFGEGPYHDRLHDTEYYLDAAESIVTSENRLDFGRARVSVAENIASAHLRSYESELRGLKRGPENPPLCTVSGGTDKDGSGGFYTADGAALFLQACVAYKWRVTEVSYSMIPAARYPGIRQLGIAALGYGGYSVDVIPSENNDLTAYDLYKRVVFGFSDGIGPNSVNGDLYLPDETRTQFEARCRLGSSLQPMDSDKFRSADGVDAVLYPGVSKQTLPDELCASMRQWSVRDIGNLSGMENVAKGVDLVIPDDFGRQASRAGFGIVYDYDGVLAGLPTANDWQSPKQYLEWLQARVTQADALIQDIHALNAVLPAAPASRIPGKDGRRVPKPGDLFIGEGDMVALGMVSAGTLAHQVDKEDICPTALDYAMLSENVARDLSSRYTMALYGSDTVRLDAAMETVCSGPGRGGFAPRERDGISLHEVRDAIWNNDVSKLVDFRDSMTTVIESELSARQYLAEAGEPEPFSIRTSYPFSGVPLDFRYPIATEAFLNQYVADTAARTKYYNRLCSRDDIAGYMAGSAPKARVFLSAPEDFDQSHIKRVLEVSRGISDGRYDGKVLSPFDGAAIDAAAYAGGEQRSVSRRYSDSVSGNPNDGSGGNRNGGPGSPQAEYGRTGDSRTTRRSDDLDRVARRIDEPDVESAGPEFGGLI